MPTQQFMSEPLNFNQNSNQQRNISFQKLDPCISNSNNQNNYNMNYMNTRNEMFNNNINNGQFNQNQHPNSMNTSMNNSLNNSMHMSKSPQIVYNNVNISEFNQHINNYNINQINPYNNNSNIINNNYSNFANFSLNNNQNYHNQEKVPIPKKKGSNKTIEGKKSIPAKISTEKYTCKFEIQIENDNDFQVAKKLIGCKVKF